MSMQCEKLKMIEKSIRKKCIDAMSAKSSFFDLTEFCQRIRSINMRKSQIFSTLFVLSDRVFVFFDRVSALQNRDVMTA